MKLVRLAVIGMIIAMFIIHIPSAYAEDTSNNFGEASEFTALKNSTASLGCWRYVTSC